jgi:hypothetical protein
MTGTITQSITTRRAINALERVFDLGEGMLNRLDDISERDTLDFQIVENLIKQLKAKHGPSEPADPVPPCRRVVLEEDATEAAVHKLADEFSAEAQREARMRADIAEDKRRGDMAPIIYGNTSIDFNSPTIIEDVRRALADQYNQRRGRMLR